MNSPARSVLAGLAALGLLLAPLGQPDAVGQTAATPTSTLRTWLPVDVFYEPPAEVPAEPGILLRSEPLTDRLLPEGTQAWQILYTSTFADDSPAVAVATALAPIDAPPVHVP